MQWRILADDLTGALDTAAAWCTASASVPVFLDQPQACGEPVQAVSTGTRDLAASDWPARLEQSRDWLCASARAYKKVDSLLRGNTLAEVAWLLHHGRFDGAVLAPAFPAQGRFTCRQRHWVGPAHQPFHTPQQTVVNDLSAALASHGVTVVCSPDRLDRQDGKAKAWVPDIRHDTDLDRLADLAKNKAGARWLWCGSAGLAQALAGRAAQDPAAAKPARPDGLVTASRHPVLRAQLRGLLESWPDAPVLDCMEPDPLPGPTAAQALHQKLQAWVNSRPAPGILAVVGGDTLLALCRCTGASALQAGTSPRNGWGQARLVDGRWQGTLLLTRSGAFGDAHDLSALWPRSEQKISA